MAKKNETAVEPSEKNTKRDYSKRRWLVPSKRAKSYAEERKNGVHMRGEKNGEKLTDFDKGMRSGYLLSQSDNAGIYKYKKALAEGKSKSQAKAISQKKGKN